MRERTLRARRRRLTGGLLTAVGLGLVLVAAFAPVRGAPAEPAEREFIITARQYEYDPPRIHVNLGDRVTLRVRSEDITHGLYLDAYGLEVTVPPMEERVVQFVADRPGKLRYRCSVICGPLHPFMVGEIIVEPNRPLALSTLLSAVVGVGVLGLAWFRKEA
ncbi:cupredoxin domain-containing protein [Limnochorda sp.]|uniref:cupredoxin domain-containing protein n=1 Tax=Limnochorda sp. TaxID=1940279 RepID=UPI0039C22839